MVNFKKFNARKKCYLKQKIYFFCFFTFMEEKIFPAKKQQLKVR
jgi:hypothetical protein